jgi:hypothetical protein
MPAPQPERLPDYAIAILAALRKLKNRPGILIFASAIYKGRNSFLRTRGLMPDGFAPGPENLLPGAAESRANRRKQRGGRYLFLNKNINCLSLSGCGRVHLVRQSTCSGSLIGASRNHCTEVVSISPEFPAEDIRRRRGS